MRRCTPLWQPEVMADHPGRALFRVSPGAYVAERSRLSKQARAAGDRALGKDLQALKRPTLAMWAIVAAGEDDRSVTDLLEVTGELAAVQGSGDRAATVEVTRRRKVAIESVVAAAVAALRAWEPSAEARRPEIRTMVDQLSRHPELGQAWIDGMLRELPDTDGFGFAAFTGMGVRDLPATPPPERRLRSVPDLAPDTTDPDPDADTRELERVERAEHQARERADRLARAARAVAAREARRKVDASVKELVAAQRKVDAALQAVRDANEILRAAEVERDAASQRHVDATARLAELTELAESNDLTVVDGDV